MLCWSDRLVVSNRHYCRLRPRRLHLPLQCRSHHPAWCHFWISQHSYSQWRHLNHIQSLGIYSLWLLSLLLATSSLLLQQNPPGSCSLQDSWSVCCPYLWHHPGTSNPDCHQPHHVGSLHRCLALLDFSSSFCCHRRCLHQHYQPEGSSPHWVLHLPLRHTMVQCLHPSRWSLRDRQCLLYLVLLAWSQWRWDQLPHLQIIQDGLQIPLWLPCLWILHLGYCSIPPTDGWSSQATSWGLRNQYKMLRIHHQLSQMLSPMCRKNRWIHQQNCLHPDRPERKKFLQCCCWWILNRLVKPLEIHDRQWCGMDHDVPGKTDDCSCNNRPLLHLHHLRRFL